MKSKIILGTVKFGIKYGINNFFRISKKDVFSILEYAYEKKIKILDTAEDYGESQNIIGMFLKENPTKKFKIISKLSSNINIKKNQLKDRIKFNCEILNTKKLHSYMIHNYNFFKDNMFLYDDLIRAKELGIIKSIGISLYDNDSINDVLNNFSEFDFIQIPFNIFDNENKRKVIADIAVSKNIKIHARSIFLQGLFFKKINDLSCNLNGLKKYLITIKKIQDKKSLKISDLALKYVIKKKFIDKVVIGVSNLQQLKNNLETCKKKFKVPNKEIEKIDVLDDYLLNPSNW